MLNPKVERSLCQYMKVDNQFRGWNAPQTGKKTDAAQAGKFQQILAQTSVQEPEDTLTISNRAPAASDIQPGDSTQVKLAKLQQMAEEADYTGMSYGEIYTAIWNRYDQAFDGNWASIYTFPTVQEDGCLATYRFRTEIDRNIGDYLKLEFKKETGIDVMVWTKEEWPQHDRDVEAYREYVVSKYGNLHAQGCGYGDMTTGEIEQAIYKKYEGKDTLRDFLNMQGELFHTGVMMDKLGEHGSIAYQRVVEEQLVRTYFFDDYMNTTAMNISQARWDAVLDGKFDAHAFAADMRETVKSSSWSFDMEKIINKGIDYLLEAVERTK